MAVEAALGHSPRTPSPTSSQNSASRSPPPAPDGPTGIQLQEIGFRIKEFIKQPTECLGRLASELMGGRRERWRSDRVGWSESVDRAPLSDLDDQNKENVVFHAEGQAKVTNPHAVEVILGLQPDDAGMARRLAEAGEFPVHPALQHRIQLAVALGG